MVEKPRGQRAAVSRAMVYLLQSQVFTLIFAVLLFCVAGCQSESPGAKSPASAEPVKVTRVTPIAGEKGNDDVSDAVEQARPRTMNAPRIVMESTEHDFGEIGPGTSHTAEFRFTNEGTAPLKITQVKSCCGVVTKGVKAGQEYASGETGVLELDYRATMQAGSLQRSLFIRSNDPVRSVVTLAIKARIALRVQCEPASLKLFLEQDNAGAGNITLKSLDGRPFAIEAFRATDKTIKVDFDPRVEATEFVLKPIVDMEKIKRNLRGGISIDLTHPECRNVRLLFDVLPEYSVSPPSIMLFNLRAGQSIEREILISSNYQDDFEVDSVTSQEGIVTVLRKTKTQNRYELMLQVTPPAAQGDRTVPADVVAVTVEGGHVIRIPLYLN